MEHFHIFLNIITLMIGTWAVIYAWQMHNSYAYPFLSPMVAFLFFYCLLLFNNLMVWYWMTNLFQNPAEYSTSLYGRLGYPLGFLFSLLWVYFLIRTVLNLHRITTFKRIFLMLFAALLMIGLFFIIYSLATPENKFHHWFHLSVMGIIYSAVILLLSVLLFFFVRGKKLPDKSHRNMIVAFTSFYFAVLVITQVIARIFSQDARIYILAFINVGFTLFPILWLKRYFLPYHKSRIANEQTKNALDRRWERYGISKREREIAELILQGLKNQEIEHRLIISPHTVKNHIYNLYKKAGVESRVQFMRLMFNDPDSAG